MIFFFFVFAFHVRIICQMMLCLSVLTQLVEVCLQAVWSRDGTHKTSLLEGAPLVDKAPLASDVILHRREKQSARVLCFMLMSCSFFVVVFLFFNFLEQS